MIYPCDVNATKTNTNSNTANNTNTNNNDTPTKQTLDSSPLLMSSLIDIGRSDVNVNGTGTSNYKNIDTQLAAEIRAKDELLTKLKLQAANNAKQIQNLSLQLKQQENTWNKQYQETFKSYKGKKTSWFILVHGPRFYDFFTNFFFFKIFCFYYTLIYNLSIYS